MLTHLSISNYALIDRLELDLEQGLSIITGETGAGKSILLGALGLILGKRADTQSLADPARKCIVEGTFNLSAIGLEDFFAAHDLDFDAVTLLRREINPQGKSRAFINDTPVNLTQLRALGEQLVDIHSQHDTLSLNYAGFPLSMIDSYAGNGSTAKKYTAAFEQFKALQSKLEKLREQVRQALADQDYFQFQYNELEEARLDLEPVETLEQELDTLGNAEEIKAVLLGAAEGLQGGESNLIAALSSIRAEVSRIARVHQPAKELDERLNSAFIELQDLAAEMEQQGEQVAHDPERISYVAERLDTLNTLLQKHRVQTTEELQAVQRQLGEKLQGYQHLDTEIAETQQQLEDARTDAFKLARKLSEQRAAQKPNIEKDVRKLLSQLGMPDAVLEVGISVSETLGPEGMDKVRFLFSANKGGAVRELHKVASGGELSRLMLSIKSLLANRTAMPTIIFDEIDTGVSGEIAGKVGNIMRQMAEGHQVISITHLPQIASKGHQHYMVYKAAKGKATRSDIRKLAEQDRVNELAKMLSGETLTDAALSNARALLEQGGAVQA